MLAEEFEVVLVKPFNYSRIVTFEASSLRFISRRHLVSADGVYRHIKPNASVLRSFGLNAFIEAGIASSYALDGVSGENGINWMSSSLVCTGCIVAVSFEDNISHTTGVEEPGDGFSPDIFIAIHHEDDVLTVSDGLRS